MKKIPVAIIHPMDPLGRKVGGIETFVSGFVNYLPPEFQVSLIGITTDSVLYHSARWISSRMGEREIDFFPLHCVPDPGSQPPIPLSLTFFLKTVFAWPKIKANLKNSILIFNRPQCTFPYLRSGLPSFLFLHSSPSLLWTAHPDDGWGRLSVVYSRLERKVLDRMKKVYCVSREGVDYYRSRYPGWSNKFIFLPTGVNHRVFQRKPDAFIQKFRRRFLARNRLNSDDILILFVGRFVQEKNIPLLLNTFAAARRCEPLLKLLLIGEGSLEKEIRNSVASLGLSSDVLFLGRQDPAKIALIIQICSVFLSTSTSEGMPISLLEALNCGLPAVVTGVGETKNLVKNGVNGRVVFELDPEILSKAVLEVICHPETYTPEKAIATATPYFVEKTMAKVYLALRECYYE